MDVLKNGEIWLYGTVGKDVVEDDEGFSSLDVRDALAKIGDKDVTVRINSGGGWADEGVAIYNILSSHKGNVSVVVEGIAASAAAVAAMAGDKIVMRRGAYMMVHGAGGVTVGNAQDHAKRVEALEAIDRSLVDIYVRQTGRPRADIQREVAAETWMDANEAVKKRYATMIADGRTQQPKAFAWNTYRRAPSQVAAMAGARQSHGFETARASADVATKAVSDARVTAFIREYCLGRQSDADVQRVMAAMKREAPAALAKALQLGPLASNVLPLPTRELPADEMINNRHQPGRDAWAEAIAKQNSWLSIHPATNRK